MNDHEVGANDEASAMGTALAEFYFERIRASASMTTLASINRIQNRVGGAVNAHATLFNLTFRTLRG